MYDNTILQHIILNNRMYCTIYCNALYST